MRRTPYIVALLALLFYVAFSALGAGPGLPLDDGWIHQTYARNLALTGQMAFMPDMPSAGSTSPLWSLLLAAGHLLRLPPLWWAFALGGLAFVGLVWAAMGLWRLLWPAKAEHDWAAGLALAFSWPLVWAAGSGMETLLFIALGFILLAAYLGAETTVAPRRAAAMGLLAGLLILARPEGLILVLLLAAAMAVRGRWRMLALFAPACLAPLLPYFWFNLTVSGVLWPNTFYAKQSEYAQLLARPLAVRFAGLLTFSLGGPEAGWRGISGAQLLLVPGLLLAGWRALQADIVQRRLWRTLPLLWAGGHIMAYALRLPVTYQHGRYLWAALPVWILFGLAGWDDLLALWRRRGRLGRLAAQTAAAVFVTLHLIFFVFGAVAYAEDVAFVENEMVAVAHWLRENSAPDALVAAHDIGALGYFAQRPLLDLAGLVSPQVTPLLQDEAALGAYALQAGAEYVVSAPGWPYETLTAATGGRLVYSSDYAWTRERGLNNMAVYRLPAGAD